MKKVIVQQNPEKEIPTELMAESIVQISRGMKTLLAGRLNRKAIVILLHHSSGLYMNQIEKVLDALESLEAMFTTGKKK